LFIRYYANRFRFRYHTYISIFVAYFCSFGIILLAPTDVALTIIGRKEVDNETIETNYEKYNGKILMLYNVLFWPCIVMGSVVMPFQEYYNRDGHFTSATRFVGTCKRLAKMYFIAGIVGGIIVGLLIAGGYFDSLEAVSVTVKAISNTVGLVAIVLLLGYGLVEFPRSVWMAANIEHQLELSQADAAVEYKAFGEMSLKCSMTVADFIKTKKNVEKMKNQRYIAACSVIELSCPKEFRSGSAGEALGLVSIDSLAFLHARLKRDSSNFDICKARLERIKMRAYFLEDLLNSRREHIANPGAEKSIKWSFEPPSSARTFDWYNEYRPWLMRISSIMLWVLSFAILMAYIAVMVGYDSGLSFFTYVTHRQGAHVGGITVFTLLTLGYFAFVMFWSLMQMRLSGEYELIAYETTPYSLSFNARMCARLAPPMVFTYFGLIYENGIENGEWLKDTNGKVLNTAFSALFGEISVIPVLGGKFNTFFPIVILVLAVLQLGNFINRFLVLVRLPGFQFGTEFVPEDQMMEGRRQLLKHKKQMERAAARGLTKAKIDKMKRKSYFGIFKSRPKKGGDEAVELREVPQEISGWVEKKAPKQLKTLVMSAWQNRMFVCRAPGELSYYDSPNTNGKPHGMIQLRVVISINRHKYGKEKEATHLDLVQSDRVFKMRFENPVECERWEKALLEWKDYALDHGHESGSSGGFIDDLAVDTDLESGNEGGSPKRRSPSGRASPTEDTSRLTEGDSMRDSWHLSHMSMMPVKKASVEDSLSARVDLSKRKRDSISAMKEKAEDKKKVMGPRRSLELVQRPQELSGVLGTKVRNGLYSTYANRYFELNGTNGLLFYYKSEAVKDQPPLGCIDLRLVLAIEDTKGNHTKQTSSNKFYLDLGEDHFKLKGKNTEDTRKWKEGLIQWQEFLLLHMGAEDLV